MYLEWLNQLPTLCIKSASRPVIIVEKRGANGEAAPVMVDGRSSVPADFYQGVNVTSQHRSVALSQGPIFAWVPDCFFQIGDSGIIVPRAIVGDSEIQVNIYPGHDSEGNEIIPRFNGSYVYCPSLNGFHRACLMHLVWNQVDNH